jgi:hypothetical protein
LRWRENPLGYETTPALVVVFDRHNGNEPGDGGVPVENQDFLAILDILDVGAEFGLQFADFGGPHGINLAQYD